MRRIKNDQTPEQRRMSGGKMPGSDATPIVPDQRHLFRAVMCDERADVVNDVADVIVRNPRRPLRFSKSTMIRRQYKIVVAKRVQIAPPTRPRLRKSVEKHDGFLGAITHTCDMKPNASGVYLIVLNGRHRARFPDDEFGKPERSARLGQCTIRPLYVDAFPTPAPNAAGIRAST